MWSDRRVVVVDDADEFVKNYRAGLEKSLDRPSRKSLLVLDVASWPKNTRLARRIDKEGLLVECTELKGAALSGWIQDTARRAYGKSITRDAARLLPELAGSAVGLLEQELAKLASYVGERESIGVDDVRTLVGGWKAETTWVMLDALTAGNLPLSLTCLEKLLVAGEAPQRILGGIAFVFRKLAVATELARQGRPLSRALADAGVFSNKISSSSQYLRKIGRPRAEKILTWLLEADFGMKGGSRLPEQMQLERLLVRLSGAA
jgi:DNA polymerase-3 subunit delta